MVEAMSNDEKIIYDVLIVGAGPAGALSANLLGKAGVRVLLVDKEKEIVEIPRAVGLCNEGSRILNAAGLMKDFENNLMDMSEVQFRSEKMDPFFSVDCSEKVNGYNIIRTLYQPDLERCMREGINRYDNVDFWTGTECLQIEDRGNSVQCRLVTDGNQYRNITCRYVMGCDGGRSNIRKMMGVEFSGQTYAQDWFIIDVKNDPEVHTFNKNVPGKTNDRDFIYFMCDPDRPGVTLPTPNGTRRWEFVVKKGESHESISSDQSIKKLLAPWGDADEMNVVRKAIYTFHSRIAKKFRVGNVFLLGDAAHLTPPFAGQGLMAGLRDAYNLSWKISSVIHGELDDEFLDTYHDERHPQAVIIVNVAKALGFLILPQKKWLSGMRDALFRGFNKVSRSDTKKSLRKTPNSTLGFWSLMRGTSDITTLMQGYEILQNSVYKEKPGPNVESVLIDDCLPNKFVLLSYGESCLGDLSKDVLDDYCAFSGESIVIKNAAFNGGDQSRSLSNALGTYNEETIYDIDNYYKSLFDDGKKVLLIRPDKMIVVCEDRKKANEALRKYMTSLNVIKQNESNAA